MEITHQKNNSTISQKHNNDLNTPSNTLSNEIVVVVNSKEDRTPNNSTKTDSYSYQGSNYKSCSITNRNNEKLASAYSSDPTIDNGGSCSLSLLLSSKNNNESEEEKQYLNAVDERCLLNLYTKQADRTLSNYRENLYHQTGSLVSNKAIGPYIAEIEKRLHRNRKKSLSDSCVYRSNTISTIGDNHDDDDDDDSCESNNSDNDNDNANNSNNHHHRGDEAENTSGNKNDGPEEKSTTTKKKKKKKVNAIVRWLNKMRDHHHHKKRYSFPTAAATTTPREAQSATFNTTT